MKKRFSIQDPVSGESKEVELREDNTFNDLMNYLIAGLEYLSTRGALKNYQNPKIRILVGNLPTKRKTKKGHIYSSFRDKIDGEDTIVMDDGLRKNETIYQMSHEIVHGLYPEGSEKKIQMITAKVLKSLSEEYPFFTHPNNERNFKTKGISSSLVSKRDIEKAYKGLIEAGVYGLREEDLGRQGGLERIFGIFFLICGFVVLFNSLSITGFSILGDIKRGFSTPLGFLFIILGIGSFYVRRIFRI